MPTEIKVYEISDAETLRELAGAAKRTHDTAMIALRDVLTPDRCALVRRLRCEDGYTWRAVAEECHEAWRASWSPPSNQLWGMALCALAAEHFGESPGDEPWN
jgi:hypothetical protein